MSELLTDFHLALQALRLRFSLVIMAVSLLGTVLLLGVLVWLTSWLFIHSGMFGFFDPNDDSWRNWLSGGFGAFMMIVIGFFIYPGLATAVACLFVEPLADRLERQNYPDLPPAHEVPTLDQVRSFGQAIMRALSLNLLALPFYFIPVVNLIVYALVNGRLLVREYFFAITLRHLSLNDANELYIIEKKRLFMAGLLLAGLFVIPVVNILAPIVATSFLIHRLARKNDSGLRQKLALTPAKVLLTPRSVPEDDGTPPPQL